MLDQLIATTLTEYEAWLLSSGWRGKEHDCVNLFVHGFLFRHVRADAVIQDFTQVGIEMAVPQPEGMGIKQAVRKDLVIWDSPRFVTWDEQWRAIHPPRAIIEWKARRKPRAEAILYAGDIEWLRRYSLHYSGFTGYAVTVDFTSPQRRVASARIYNGEITEDFHRKVANGSHALSSLAVAKE